MRHTTMYVSVSILSLKPPFLHDIFSYITNLRASQDAMLDLCDGQYYKEHQGKSLKHSNPTVLWELHVIKHRQGFMQDGTNLWDFFTGVVLNNQLSVKVHSTGHHGRSEIRENIWYRLRLGPIVEKPESAWKPDNYYTMTRGQFHVLRPCRFCNIVMRI